MNRVLCPDDASAAPDHELPLDEAWPDFRRWLASVQAQLRVEPTPDDRSSSDAVARPDFPAHPGGNRASW